MLPFLLEALSDDKLQQSILFEILEEVVSNILTKIQPSKGVLLWNCLEVEWKKLYEKHKTFNNSSTENNLQLILKIIGQCIEFRNGRFLQTPLSIIQLLLKTLNECQLTTPSLQIIVQISILLLL